MLGTKFILQGHVSSDLLPATKQFLLPQNIHSAINPSIDKPNDEIRAFPHGPVSFEYHCISSFSHMSLWGTFHIQTMTLFMFQGM